jgi:hypothetical protein
VAPDQFHDFLERSLELLAREKRAVYSRMCAMLDAMVLSIRIDSAPVVVTFAPDCTVTRGDDPGAMVRVESDRRAILDVIDGNTTLEQAVLDDRILLLGSVPDLVRFHDGLRMYLSGAVRAPGFAVLLDEYLADGPNPRDPAPRFN